MLKLAVEADDMANESLKALESQNETIKKQQDEVAGMEDELNVADRKIKGIKSFFSHLGNQFKKDNREEHQKARQKYEKELAKGNFRTEAERMKNEEKEHEDKYKALQETQKEILEQDAQRIEQAKLKSKQDYKAIKKGTATANGGANGGDTVVLGKLVFTANALPGEQCEAENDLDQIGQHVKSLKTKAESMGIYVEESNKRIGDLHTDLQDVQSRTLVATKKGGKIIKTDSFF
jgi:chromosome segregation ATPase